jgi:BirA family transcriptional regulator, biotin operon repressor / biotin---[acetyl-CoA-carboxylase] ligase
VHTDTVPPARARGMTVTDTPPPALAWPTLALQDRLQTLWPGLQVQVRARVGSTNTDMLDLLRAAPGVAHLLVAELQTQGRGRNGRVWHAQAGTSLTFTFGLPFAPADWSGLSLAVGVALAEALEPLPVGAMPRLQLKWPNDLWLRDADLPHVHPHEHPHEHPGTGARWRKLGGILIETMPVGPGRACLVGVGLNVLPRADVAGLTSGYACLQELDAKASAPALLARVAPALLAALQRFERAGLQSAADGFARRDLLRGQTVTTTMDALPQGVADGIDGQGALRVRHPGGVALVHSGEVSVRPPVASHVAMQTEGT